MKPHECVFGYEYDEASGKLVVNKEEAAMVQKACEGFLHSENVRDLMRATAEKVTSMGYDQEMADRVAELSADAMIKCIQEQHEWWQYRS